MVPRSTLDPAFQATVEKWLREQAEILVVILWPNAGGARSYEFFKDPGAFALRLQALQPRTSVIVLKEPQLPVRGSVDESLIRRAIEAVPEGAEYLIAGLDVVTDGSGSWFPNKAGDVREEFVQDLRDWRPHVRVAVGLHPTWWEDREGVISAYVPDADGTVRPAAY